MTAETIEHCWIKSRVLQPEQLPRTQERQEQWENALKSVGKAENQVYSALLAHLQALQEKRHIRESISIQELVNPRAESVVDSLDEETLLETIVDAFLPPDEGADDDVESDLEPVTTKQALQAVKTLREWVLQQETQEDEFMRHLKDVTSRLQKAHGDALEQAKMDMYLLPIRS